jgi:hypothetical protein
VLDLQHRDLVAAGVDGEQVAAVGAQLQRALRCVRMAGARAANRERRPRDRGQAAIGVTVEAGDAVDGCCVVVDVDVPDDAGSVRPGRRGGCAARHHDRAHDRGRE